MQATKTSKTFPLLLTCALIFSFISTGGTATVYASVAPARANCAFVDTAALRCIKEEQINVTQIGSLRLPNVIIIGSSKTGTTALSALLETHPDVKVGRGPEGDYETNFLLPHRPDDNRHRFHIIDSKDSLQRYSKAYFGGVLTEAYKLRATVIVDKVPAYSSHPLTPYMAKLVFTQPHPKFIFTVRDPIAADMSLYKYRGWSGKMKMGYDEFAVPRMKIFKKWWECREQTFNKILMGDAYSNQQPGHYVTTRDLYNPDVFTWETTQMIEEEIYAKCDGMGNSPISHNQFPLYDDFYQERLYAINLRRWAQVYGEDSIMCFTSEDFMYHQPKIKKLVASHLGIDPELFQIKDHMKYIDASASSTSADVFESDYNRTYARVLALTLAVKETKGTLDWALGEVRRMFDNIITPEDQEYIRRMCKRNYDDMPE